MLRTLLIAVLAACQGFTSLAGTIVCLHADGGFCVERQEAECCRHHAPSVDECCQGHLPLPTGNSGIGDDSSCDCTHLAISVDVPLARQLGEEPNVRRGFGDGDSMIAAPASLATAAGADSTLAKQVPPAGFNRGRFNDPAVDDLLDRAARSSDDAERAELFKSVQRLLAEQVPCISLWYKTNVAVAQRSLTGIRINPLADFLFLKDVARVPAVPSN